MHDKQAWQAGFMGSIASLRYIETLVDRLDDIVFSVKDLQGRYVLVSQAAVARCGLRSKSQAIGMTAFDLFPAPMAEHYARQDAQLFRNGKTIVDRLDLTLYRNHMTGWCLTTKEALHDAAGSIIGLACISKDLNEPSRSAFIDTAFADVIEYMHAHLGEVLCTASLALRCGLSQAQLDRRMKKVFQLSCGRYLLKIRMDAAADMLAAGNRSIGEIAQLSGFFDQSGLSRHFRKLTGMSPRQYRQLVAR